MFNLEMKRLNGGITPDGGSLKILGVNWGFKHIYGKAELGGCKFQAPQLILYYFQKFTV